MALIFSTFLWPPEPLLQYPCVCAQFLAWRTSGKLPANFSANFDGEFFHTFFSLVVPAFQAPPPPKKSSRPKLTPRIVGIPLQFHLLEPNFCHADFRLTGGGTNIQASSRVYQKHACAFMRTLANLGEVWRTLANPQQHIHENLRDIHQSSGEGTPHSPEFR